MIIVKLANAQGWTLLSSGTNNFLSSVYFSNKTTGFVVGNSGTVLKTTDAGVSWLFDKIGTDQELHSVYFTDSNIGYTVGFGYPPDDTTFYNSSGLLLKTINGGKSWNNIPLYEFQSLEYRFVCESVYFVDQLTGYIVANEIFDNSGYIFKTEDGGNNWYVNFTNEFYYPDIHYLNLRNIHFFNKNIGCVVGEEGKILKFDGEYWGFKSSGTSVNLNSVFFINTNIGFIVGDSGTILKTTNGGENWIKLYSGTTITFNSVYFTDSNTGYAVGYGGGKLLKTVNGGKNWIKQYYPTNNFLSSVYFTDSNTGYAVGYGGKIIKTSTGGVGISESEKNVSKILIYPNPATDKIFIECTIRQKFIMQVFNTVGQCVLQRELNTQTNTIDISSLTRGIYILKLTSPNETYEKKIIKE